MLVLMDVDIVEFVAAAAVIEMHVAGDDLEGFVEQIGKVEFEAGHAEPGIDQQIGVTALHQPQVGTVFPGVQRLGDAVEIIANTLRFEPRVALRVSSNSC